MNGSRRKKRFKYKLAEWFADKPLLRLLLFKFWFRLAFLAFLLLITFVVLFVQKIWNVSPAGFSPIIRVSGLDLAQAWSLKRTAERAMQSGEFETANYGWRAAIANNPADPDAIRGFLRLVLATSPGKKKAASSGALGYVSWLLRLTQTNQIDVVLAARIYDAFELHELALYLLAPREQSLTTESKGIFLRALFETGRIAEFGSRWQRDRKELAQDPTMRMYEAAWQAGWGPPEQAAQGRQHLAAARRDSALEEQVARLQLSVARQLQDIELYRANLEWLNSQGKSTTAYEVNYWLLLHSLGRADEARKKAEAYRTDAPTLPEVLFLVDAYLRLSLHENARDLLRSCAANHKSSPEFWLVYANLLMTMREWKELTELTWQIRNEPDVREPLAAYSYYLEARSELALGRQVTYQDAIRHLKAYPVGEPRLTKTIALGLVEIGEAALARHLLLKIQGDFTNAHDYWHALFVAAYRLRDAELARTAAQRAYELQPGSPLYRNNYAATLLMFRERPELAVQLTFELLRQRPSSTEARLNHALALAQNQRHAEAAALLKPIDPLKLSPAETTTFHLCRFDSYASLGDNEQARNAADRIDRQHLLPPQTAWIEKRLAQLPPRQSRQL